MVVNRPLNEIFSTYSNIAVIRELRDTTNGLTGREIAKRAGLSAPSAIKALSHMESLKIVNRQIGGRDHLFTLNFNNYFVKNILIAALQAEAGYLDMIKSELKKSISKELESLLLFGSVARKEETIKSDFDICVVLRDSDDKIMIKKKVNSCRDLLYKNYGINLAPFYIASKEFKRRAKAKKPPVDDIIKEGVVVSGKSIKGILNDK